MKKRILIVEDNIALSHIQKDWLEREGYSVATAMNEPFAHKLLRKERFDLILSDVCHKATAYTSLNGLARRRWISHL